MKKAQLTISMIFCMILTVVFSASAQLNKTVEVMSGDELIANGFRKLFNGIDLTGWDGPPGSWRIEDGALTWESTIENPLKNWPYLIWTGSQPENFELLVDFRLSSLANSGVNIRSQRIDNEWGLGGYQADLTGDDRYTGTIYRDHPLRPRILRGQNAVESPDGELHISSIGDGDDLQARNYHKGEWNRIRISCVGPEISFYLNGVLMSKLTDNGPNSSKKGYIAFQMHQGPPMKIQYKNIFLKEL